MERRYVRLRVGDKFVSRHFDKNSFKPSLCVYFSVLKFVVGKEVEEGVGPITLVARSDTDPPGINRKMQAIYAYVDSETGVVNSVDIEKRKTNPLDGSRRIYLKI
jgi:hypothetical protein